MRGSVFVCAVDVVDIELFLFPPHPDEVASFRKFRELRGKINTKTELIIEILFVLIHSACSSLRSCFSEVKLTDGWLVVGIEVMYVAGCEVCWCRCIGCIYPGHGQQFSREQQCERRTWL